jgi:hypothetical protein
MPQHAEYLQHKKETKMYTKQDYDEDMAELQREITEDYEVVEDEESLDIESDDDDKPMSEEDFLYSIAYSGRGLYD